MKAKGIDYHYYKRWLEYLMLQILLQLKLLFTFTNSTFSNGFQCIVHDMDRRCQNDWRRRQRQILKKVVQKHPPPSVHAIAVNAVASQKRSTGLLLVHSIISTIPTTLALIWPFGTVRPALLLHGTKYLVGTPLGGSQFTGSRDRTTCAVQHTIANY